MAKSSYLVLSIIICGFYFFSNCRSIDPKESKSPDKNTDTSGLVKATVIDYRELDGCEFLLVVDNNQKLQPLNLPEEFKKNNFEVYISYKRVNEPSVCMAGWVVHLNKIIRSPDKSEK